ncbi:UPF0489 family protein [Salinispirillum marinum]|uniref:UPF0489 family protein n=2 Tax=Saccharospirillaceae TaxID=255527 RepID=A0ABV8BCV0_9GAMM
MADWILPFQGRNGSLAVSQNFLWRTENIYIMDNHRAALWCWLQHMSSKSQYGVFHIDAHYDCAGTIRDDEITKLPDLGSITFQDYLDISEIGPDGKKVPLIRWDNYLFLFERLYRSQIAEYFFATHGKGDEPTGATNWEEINMSSLPAMYGEFLHRYGADGWILNIDLDYFFSRQPKDLARLQSEHYISEIFSATRKALDSGLVSCLTICLSPECCGGWEPAEEICYQLCGEIGIDFRLPESSQHI